MSTTDYQGNPNLAERAEDLSDEQVLALYESYPIDDRVVRQLIDSRPRVLVGSRGTGKSMLMRYAQASLARDAKKRVLALYVNLYDYLLLDPLRFSGADAPAAFRSWLSAKVIAAALRAIEQRLGRLSPELELATGEHLPSSAPKLRSLVSTALSTYRAAALDESGHDLSKPISRLSRLPSSGTDWLIRLLRSCAAQVDCDRTVILFDEAAHTLSRPYQAEFFRYFRTIRTADVAPKAAVYPGATAFGPSFDIGHDAKLIAIDREETDSAYLDFFHGILKRRLEAADWTALIGQRDLLDVLLYAASGNPRAAVVMADRLLERANDTGRVRRRAFKEVLDWYATEVLWSLHENLAQKAPMLSAEIELGRDLVEGLVVRDLRKRNSTAKQQSPYFAVSKSAPSRVSRALDLLQYAGLVVPRGEVRRGRQQPLERFLLNLSVALTQKVFSGERGATLPVTPDALASLSLANYKEYVAPAEFEKLVNRHPPSLPPCANCGATRASAEVRFCGQCGSPLTEASVFYSVVRTALEELPLSDRLKDRLKKGGFRTVGDILRDEERVGLQKIKYIGAVRSSHIRAVAEEYFSA